MARILGQEVPSKKRIKIGLTYIYGVGPKRALDIIEALKLDAEIHVDQLTNEDISRLNSHIESTYLTGGDLKRKTRADIQRLIANKSYRGRRHVLSLPCRGQRTRTNTRTRKGKKKTIANKKK